MISPDPPANAYVLISPCRDEAAYVQRTIDAVVAQTVQPQRWIIVDDGSTDATPQILQAAAQQHRFITVMRRGDRGTRSVGPGVVDAFYAGYEALQGESYGYLCKLDMDLDLPPRYFEILRDRMVANPRIGTCSGKPYFIDSSRNSSGALISERCGDETSVGMTKFYRRACFEQIGGFVREVMWDTIDCHRCRMAGWIACSWDEPDLRFTHLRAMGSSHKGILAGRMRLGYGQYFMGTAPLYMAVSVLYRMAHPPLGIGGLAMGWGYLWNGIRRSPRYPDRAFRTFLQRYHWQCLVKGKAHATTTLNAQQRAVWDAVWATHPAQPTAHDPSSKL